MQRVVMVASAVHPIPPSKAAAAEWWMLQSCRRLRGWEPHIVAIAAKGQASVERVEGVTLHRVSIGRAYKRVFQKLTRLDPWPYEKRVGAQVRAIAPAIVHVHNAPRLFCALAGPVDPQRLVLHLHNEVKVACAERVRWCITPSAYLASVVRRTLTAAEVRVVPNGVDVALFGEATSRRAALPATADGKKVIVYAGRMSPEKGPLLLVRAFAVLRQRRDDVFLMLVGEFRHDGPACDRTRYGDEIRRVAVGFAADCSIVGVVPHDHMQDVYALADLVVVPSTFEAFGMVALEALAAGKPVLAFATGGLPEFIVDGENGFLMPGTDEPLALADRIDALLADPARLERVGQAARASAVDYDWSVVARRLEAAYAEVLAAVEAPLSRTRSPAA